MGIGEPLRILRTLVTATLALFLLHFPEAKDIIHLSLFYGNLVLLPLSSTKICTLSKYYFYSQ